MRASQSLLRRTLSLLLLLGLAVGALFAGSPATAAPALAGKMHTLRIATSLVRPWHGTDNRRTVLVYTPAGYDDPANADRRYPVIYLLHGSPGNEYNFIGYGNWPAHVEEEVRAGQIPPVILVMPDGNYVGQKQGDSEWADSADRKDRFETWLVHEIVPYIDEHFRTRTTAPDRILAGVSEGGLGAVNLTLRNPRLFGAAIGLSGYYDMRGFGWGHIVMNDSEADMSFNSPLYYIPERVQSGRVPPEWKNLRVFVGAGPDEHPYTRETREVADALRSAGVTRVQVSIAEGKHDWGMWTQLFLEGLRFVLPT